MLSPQVARQPFLLGEVHNGGLSLYTAAGVFVSMFRFTPLHDNLFYPGEPLPSYFTYSSRPRPQSHEYR